MRTKGQCYCISVEVSGVRYATHVLLRPGTAFITAFNQPLPENVLMQDPRCETSWHAELAGLSLGGACAHVTEVWVGLMRSVPLPIVLLPPSYP